jgi:uncharacterized protein YndB with AHSA1/START domain
MHPTASQVLPSSAARLELEVTIDAPAAEVWRALIERPDAWWIDDLRCLAQPSRVELEAHAGGRLHETGEDGSELLWFHVIAVEPGRSLNLAGTIAPPFGGPCQTCLLIRLETGAGGTLVRLTSSMHGHVEEPMLAEMEPGWRALLERGLRALVEEGRRA